MKYLRDWFQKPAVKAYWWKGRENFGDVLAPLLLARFAYLDRIEWSPIATAEIASIGSILEHIPLGWRGYIVGSGVLRPSAKLHFYIGDVEILALRGPLSAQRLSAHSRMKIDPVLGDPGLLANELIEPQEKRWDLGIIPHWSDFELGPKYMKMLGLKHRCRVISPAGDPLTVIRDIASCHRVVTSSLHGMIVADAIGGIPRKVEVCERLASEGGTFKFQDYSASINCPFEAGKMYEPPRNRIDDRKFDIYTAYRELGRCYAQG